jgi:hypothetical protein
VEEAPVVAVFAADCGALASTVNILGLPAPS